MPTRPLMQMYPKRKITFSAQKQVELAMTDEENTNG